jgi:hypothetical protein
MPHLAFDIGFCAQLGKLQGTDKQGVFDAWEKFERPLVWRTAGRAVRRTSSAEHRRRSSPRSRKRLMSWCGLLRPSTSTEHSTKGWARRGIPHTSTAVSSSTSSFPGMMVGGQPDAGPGLFPPALALVRRHRRLHRLHRLPVPAPRPRAMSRGAPRTRLTPARTTGTRRCVTGGHATPQS